MLTETHTRASVHIYTHSHARVGCVCVCVCDANQQVMEAYSFHQNVRHGSKHQLFCGMKEADFVFVVVWWFCIKKLYYNNLVSFVCVCVCV